MQANNFLWPNTALENCRQAKNHLYFLLQMFRPFRISHVSLRIRQLTRKCPFLIGSQLVTLPPQGRSHLFCYKCFSNITSSIWLVNHLPPWPSGDTNLEIANRVARISPLTTSCHPLRSFGVAQCWMAAILNTYYPADDRRLRPLLLDPLGGCQATVLVALFWPQT